MWLGWDCNGDEPFEWVTATLCLMFMWNTEKKHGEGFHHLGVNVTDMDDAIKKISPVAGAPPSQAAAWKTAHGKGRAVYLDTEPYGGVTLELIASSL